MTILAYLNCLNIVKKKHANICRKTFANIRKIYYLCISKPTVKSHTKPLPPRPKAPPPRHLRWLTPPLMEGSEWPWLLKAPPRATFGGLPLPLTQGYSVFHFSFFTFRFSLFVLPFSFFTFPLYRRQPFLPFYPFTFLPLKMPFTFKNALYL